MMSHPRSLVIHTAEQIIENEADAYLGDERVPYFESDDDPTQLGLEDIAICIDHQ